MLLFVWKSIMNVNERQIGKFHCRLSPLCVYICTYCIYMNFYMHYLKKKQLQEVKRVKNRRKGKKDVEGIKEK